MSRYWLMKSEPESYSITDLERDGRTSWEGVRNYQARNLMRDEMRVGDGVLFYHSSADPPGVAGLAKVARAAYPDRTALDPGSHYHDPKATDEDTRWVMVDIEFVERFQDLVPLAKLKETTALEGMVVTGKSRLSVQPATEPEFEIVRKMGSGPRG
jgi:predicted RNA-binding protein with PUA-like domain